MSSGYVECPCCSEIVVADDDSKPILCDDCVEAGGDECRCPRCEQCNTPATFCTDAKWHPNCDCEISSRPAGGIET